MYLTRTEAEAVEARTAALEKHAGVQVVTAVVDTVRRHPTLLAQTALTVDHLDLLRFALGIDDDPDHDGSLPARRECRGGIA